jgi:hypothetical protein
MAVYGAVRTLAAAVVAVAVAISETGRPSALQAGSIHDRLVTVG